MQNYTQKGSIELVVLGLLAALIVVLALPLLTNIDQEDVKSTQEKVPVTAPQNSKH